MSAAATIQARVDAFVSGVIGGGPLGSAFNEALRRRRSMDDGMTGGPSAISSVPRTADDDPWIRRRGGGGGEGGLGSGVGSRGAAGSRGGRHGGGLVARAFAGDRGQAAVIKIKSYASGAERVKASAGYVTAGADHVAEKDDGTPLIGAGAINAVLDRWEQEYFATDARRETSDTVSLALAVDGALTGREAAGGLAAALAGHRYAFATAERRGGSVLEIVATLQSDREVTYRAQPTLDAPAGAERTTRFRLRPTDKAVAVVATAIGRRLGRETSVARADFHHGEPATLKALARLAHGGGREIATDAGLVLRSVNERLALAQGWRRFMASRQTRDTMHLIVSSRPGTDRKAFVAATRTWLKDAFGRHEYLFTVHDDTAHTHVHAVIVMRTRDRYERLRTSPAVLQAWRERLAERAREHGIAMFAERRLVKGQARPTAWRQGERAERPAQPHRPERASEAGLMAVAQAEWIETLRVIETAHSKEPGSAAAATYARGVVARLEAGLAAWRSQSRNNNNERAAEVERAAARSLGTRGISGGQDAGQARVLPATLHSIDAMVHKVEDGMVTEAQARTALNDTHSRIMRLAVMSRSAETRARFAAIATDIHERGNRAVTAAVERRRAELDRSRAPSRTDERDAERSRQVHADGQHHPSFHRERADDDRRPNEQTRSLQTDDRRQGRVAERRHDRERERE